MSNILNDLGLDENNFEWQNLAVCSGMEVNLFFDKYEIDINIAKGIDEACLSCPVSKICYETGVENNEYGVWGGIYLSAGTMDKSKNLHKTKSIWNRLKRKNG